ncbi:MAG TPA: DUF222 domain-containing protein [Nonomuraea sp.]|nr:DUF222 domain-containing protein [Nonomuraea sp.]
MAVLEDLAKAMDALAAFEPAQLGDEDALVALQRQLDRLTAVTARAAAAFDDTDVWSADGARSPAGWLSITTRISMKAAKRRLHLGRAVRDLPGVEAEWLAGRITDEHVALLVGARALNAEAFERDEADLVDKAGRLTFTSFAKVIAYWRWFADPDRIEDDARDDREARKVHLSESLGGTWHLDGFFDPISGTIISNELRRLEQQLFDDDWKDARARLGDAAKPADLARTASQRRADAFVEMAMRSRAMPPGSRRPEPLFTVLVGYEALAGPICELANGTVVTPGSLLGWLDRTAIERIVFDSASGVIDVGARRRLFEGATRRAIEVRDRQCFHRFCEVPASECEADHIEPWAAGGLTVQANGRMACGSTTGGATEVTGRSSEGRGRRRW